MTRYIIRRILWAGVLLIGVTVVTYVIFFLTPTDPAKLVAGRAARPIDIERARHYLRMDKPVPYQYANFLGRLTGIRWDREHNTVWNFKFKWPSLGQSFATRQDVNKIVGHAAPVTASLVFGGALVWMLIALPLGSAFGARSADVILVQRLRHIGADHSRIERGEEKCEREPRQDHVVRPLHGTAARRNRIDGVAVTGDRRQAELVAEEERKDEADPDRVRRDPDQYEDHG